MTGPRLLHMGGAVVDFVYRAEGLPARGREVIADTFVALPGGGFNLMVAARRAGMNVVYGGPHGEGPMGDLVRGALAEAGIEILRPPVRGVDTGNCVVVITPDGERSFLSWPGAEGRLDAADLAAIRPGPTDHVFLSGYTLAYPDSGEAIAAWLGSIDPSVLIAFDPAPVVGSIPPPLLEMALARATWISANLDEAEALTGETEPARQADRLLAHPRGQARGILLRAGFGGAWLALRDGGLHYIPPFPVSVVDTTGAGDTHLGVFLARLAAGSEPIEAARFANAAAAIVVTRLGGSRAPHIAEIEGFIAASLETM